MVKNHVFILQDPNCLEIQVKVFIMFLYISKFILQGISSLSENFIKSDDLMTIAFQEVFRLFCFALQHFLMYVHSYGYNEEDSPPPLVSTPLLPGCEVKGSESKKLLQIS